MQHKDLPQRWKDRIADYLKNTVKSPYKQFGASDFPANQAIHIRFEDGSFANFKHAFVLKAPEWYEVAVFTEHSGYHIFSIYAEIEEVEMG